VAAAIDRLESRRARARPSSKAGGSLRGSVDLATLMAADQAAKVGDLALDGPSSRRTTHSTMSSECSPTATSHGCRSWPTTGWPASCPRATWWRHTARPSPPTSVRSTRSARPAAARSGDRSGLGPRRSPVSETAWPRDSVLVSVMRGREGHRAARQRDPRSGRSPHRLHGPAAREALQSLLASRIAIEAEAS
jgi:hypothetical protein